MRPSELFGNEENEASIHLKINYPQNVNPLQRNIIGIFQ